MCCMLLLSASLFTVYIQITTSIQINTIVVPSAVKNDSGTDVILDCKYTIRPGDHGLVVKWFLNGQTCVYQWIPPKKPQGLGPLKGRLDLSYKASDDTLTAYRSLKIINPTTDIAGEYRCFVSTYADEDSASKYMIVFEPEEKITMELSKPKNGRVNFTCNVFGVYPDPLVTIYKNTDYAQNMRKNLEVIEWIKSKHSSGRYDLSATATALVANLTPGDIMDCEMKIPGTGYIKKKSLVYYPPLEARSAGAALLSMLHIILVVAVWIILFI